MVGGVLLFLFAWPGSGTLPEPGPAMFVIHKTDRRPACSPIGEC